MAVPAMPQVRSSLPAGGMPVPRACRKFDRIVNFVRTKKTGVCVPARARRQLEKLAVTLRARL